MKFNSLKFFIKDALNSIVRNITISLASLFTITVTLLIMGMISLLFVNASHFLNVVQNKIQVNVYLADKINATTKTTLIDNIKKYDGVSGVQDLSKEQAAQEFNASLAKTGNGGAAISEDQAGILPETLRVSFTNLDKVDGFMKYVKSQPGVNGPPQTDAVLVNTMIKFSKNFGVASGVVLIIFMIVSLSLIVNNIKLAVFSRRKEIGIMKFVGATDSFIRWPFIFEGIIIGVFGAIISSIILFFAYKGLYSFSGGASSGTYRLLNYNIVLLPGLPVLLLIGGCIGVLGSTIAIKKFLKV